MTERSSAHRWKTFAHNGSVETSAVYFLTSTMEEFIDKTVAKQTEVTKVINIKCFEPDYWKGQSESTTG